MAKFTVSTCSQTEKGKWLRRRCVLYDKFYGSNISSLNKYGNKAVLIKKKCNCKITGPWKKETKMSAFND